MWGFFSREQLVLPQWKPMKVSFRRTSYLPRTHWSYMDWGTVLLMSSRVVGPPETHTPMYSDRAP